MSNSFGAWEKSIHDLPDQKKRIVSARKAATSPESVDRKEGIGVFPGSGKIPYQTTFDSCTCVDFLKRQLPCKHMYRLAMECGQFDGPFSSGENKNIALKRQLSFSDVIAEIENLPDSQQEIIAHMLYEAIYHGAKYIEIEQNPESAQLLTSSIIQYNGNVDALTILQRMRKKDISALLEKHGCQYDAKLKKADLALWCSTNAYEIQADLPVIYKLSFVEEFNKAQRRTYSYLLRKFEWDYHMNDDMMVCRCPHGSVLGESGLYWFPNDEVTTLLTRYGYNRCINGFAEEKVDQE